MKKTLSILFCVMCLTGLCDQFGTFMKLRELHLCTMKQLNVLYSVTENDVTYYHKDIDKKFIIRSVNGNKLLYAEYDSEIEAAFNKYHRFIMDDHVKLNKDLRSVDEEIAKLNPTKNKLSDRDLESKAKSISDKIDKISSQALMLKNKAKPLNDNAIKSIEKLEWKSVNIYNQIHPDNPIK